jgi:hypothetical protein
LELEVYQKKSAALGLLLLLSSFDVVSLSCLDDGPGEDGICSKLSVTFVTPLLVGFGVTEPDFGSFLIIW